MESLSSIVQQCAHEGQELVTVGVTVALCSADTVATLPTALLLCFTAATYAALYSGL